MQFIKSDININFIGNRKVAYILSAAMILISIASLLIHGGPRYGVDFSGGTSIQIKFASQVQIKAVKKGLAPLGLGKSSVQRFGAKSDNEYQIRTNSAFMSNPGFADKVKKSLSASTGVEVKGLSLDMVGPQVSQDLRKKALMAMFYALLFITIYISGRFEFKWMMSGAMALILGGAVYLITQFESVGNAIPLLIIAALIISLIFCWYLKLKFAMGAIIALIHDITITMGIFSILNIEFNLPIIAALLTIIGYSLNDTIIVYDRIRENTKKMSKKGLDVIINRSINETLSRTILTSLTTLLVVVSLFVLGGGVIHNFALAMLIGITIGTYSSIYVASPILMAWDSNE